MSLRLKLRNGVWYVRGTVVGPNDKVAKVYKSTDLQESRKADADKIRAAWEAQLLQELIYGKRNTVPFERCADEYLNFEERSPRTRTIVGRLTAHFGAKDVSEIGREAADAAVVAILGPKASPATKRRVVYGPLTAILNHGNALGWCDKPSFGKLPRVPRQETPWLTPAQARALIDAAADHLKPLLTFLFCTGARLSEALDLTWDDVDLPAAKVVFRGTKGEKLSGGVKPRVAALPPAAVDVLANYPGGREGRVFRREDGEPYEDRERQEGGQIRTAWRTACRNAGLPGEWIEAQRRTRSHWRRADGSYGSGEAETRTVRVWVPKNTPHDCRHSWATWLYCVSKDPMLVRDEGGWSSLAMVERYSHLAPSETAYEVALVWGESHPRVGRLPTRPQVVEMRRA